MTETEQKRQALQTHAEALLERVIQAVLTPSAAGDLLFTLKEDLARKVDATAGETLDRMRLTLPKSVGKNEP